MRLDSFGADGGQPVVEVEDALPEAASFVSRVELVAVDAGPDAGAGDVQAEAVLAAGFVGDAGELQGGALAPRDSHQLLSDVDRVGVVWAQPVDGGDLVGEPADDAFGVADVAALCVA